MPGQGCPKCDDGAYYRIGTKGQAWGAAERSMWLNQTRRKRSYHDEVLSKLDALGEGLVVHDYGSLSTAPERYPLKAVTTADWDGNKPCVLVTGGVHGYETSGVQGALLFLDTKLAEYRDSFNICVAPCVSPFGYEHVERWNAHCSDPNRSFKACGTTEESSQLLAFLETLDAPAGWVLHLDLHETTDTDESEFMPARAAEKGEQYTPCEIPDGFYCVGDSCNPQLAFHRAIIDAVRVETHIAPAVDGVIIDEPVVQEGLIVVPAAELGLCCSLTKAPFVTTTEVYPDSPKTTPDACNRAQRAAVCGALDYVLAHAA